MYFISFTQKKKKNKKNQKAKYSDRVLFVFGCLTPLTGYYRLIRYHQHFVIIVSAGVQ